MTMGFILRTIAEVAVVAFLIWGFLHEDKFIRFENRLARIVAVNIRRARRRRLLRRQSAFPAAPAKALQPAASSAAQKQPLSPSPVASSRPVRRRRKKAPQNAA